MAGGTNIPSGQFNFRNNFDDISAVITCSTAGGAYSPIYQQSTPTPTHAASKFTPKESYKIWLQQNIDSAVMLAEVDSTAYEVEYPKGLYLQTITLNNLEVWNGNVKQADSAPDSTVSF